MTGFMTTVNGIECQKGLDLILHTPGGDPTAAEVIVNYLRSKFNSNIRVIVPQLAMLLVPGDFDHSVTGEKSQKVTREKDQKSHLTPLIIRFPEDCQKQFLPFL